MLNIIKGKKRPILLTLLIFVIILQFWYINVQDKRLVEKDHYYIELMEQVKVELDRQHEEVVNEHLVTIQQLSEEIVDLNELNEKLEQDINELNEVIKIIAKQLNVPKEKILNSPQSVSRGGGDWQSFQMTHYVSDCRGCIGITKQGVDVRNTIYHQNMRVIAVDPRVIKLGSIVEVRREDGSTFKAVASDTGGRIKGKVIDLLVTDTKTAVAKGRQSIQLRILKVGE